MKNSDVPMWDKGDRTDDFVKGGGGVSLFGDSLASEEKDSMITTVFESVLGRKPTSRELSLYRYSSVKKDALVLKLVATEEHKDVVQKGRDYPVLQESESLAKSTIMKLKHSIEDQNQAVVEMKGMLSEKNIEIQTLRDKKDAPYLNSTFVLEKDMENHKKLEREARSVKVLDEPKTFLDHVSDFIKLFSK